MFTTQITFIYDSNIDSDTHNDDYGYTYYRQGVFIIMLLIPYPVIGLSISNENKRVYLHVCIGEFIKRDKLKKLIFYFVESCGKIKVRIEKVEQKEGHGPPLASPLVIVITIHCENVLN